MKNKMIKISTKVMSAMIAASIVISSTTIPTYAAELPTEVQETAIETVVETPEVEGQGDVIDDQFAYVEGQGDVIDDQFAVAPEAETQPATETVTEAPVVEEQPVAEVEGQGDVIDDQFAVTPEAEAAVETEEVAEDNTEVTAPSVNSFVGVGSADSLAAVGSADSAKNDEEYKSELTKSLEEFNKGLSPLNVKYGDPIRKKVNDCDFLGDDEKEYINEIVTTGLSTGEGVIFGEYIPGFGAFRKAAKMVESVSKALDASDANKKEDALKYTAETFTNGTEAIISAIPGGGLVLAGAKVQNALAGYCAKKITSFFKWLF